MKLARSISLCTALLVLVGTSICLAQNALVTGIVVSESGKGVPQASVTLTNTNTGFTSTIITDAHGIFTFASVPPSETYVIRVELSGYAALTQGPVRIKVAGTQLISLDLKKEESPGQLDQRLNPDAPDISLDFLNTALGGVVEARRVRTLPLAGRDLVDLALLTPGTYPVEQGSRLEGASLAVNGVRPSMNNFLLDGTDNNDYTINQSLPFQIVEAMQEFRVQSSAITAAYGRSGGGQINIISRSGERTAHGTLFGFNRNSAFSADNYFPVYDGGMFDRYGRQLRAGGKDPFQSPVLQALYDNRQPHVAQNQFGGNLGKALGQRFFMFANWESTRVANPRPLFEQVPGLAARNSKQAFSNLYPLPNAPLVSGITDLDTRAFYIGDSANSTSTDNFLERLDWRGKSSSMSFKHNIQRIVQTQGGDVPKSAAYPGNGIDVSGRNQNFSYSYVRQFTRTVNEARMGWSRFRLGTLAADRDVTPASVGLSGPLNYTDRGLPTMFLSYWSFASSALSTLGADANTPSRRVNSVWSVADNLSFVSGRHVAKLGFELRHVRLNVVNEGFGRGILAVPDPTVGPLLASIARVQPEFGGGFDRAFRTLSSNLFYHHQVQLGPHFTMNFGVRHEINTPPIELRDRLVNYFPAAGGLMRAASTQVLDPAGKSIGTAGQAPRSGFETDKNNIAPHMGFAWAPRGTRSGAGAVVIRAGYALAFDQQPLEPSVNMLLNPPFVRQYIQTYPTLQTAFARNTAPGSYSIIARDPDASRLSEVHQFHLSMQHRLSTGTLYEVSYVGSLGRRLPRLRDLSPCNPVLTATCNKTKLGAFWDASIFNQENTATSNFHSLLARFDAPSLGRASSKGGMLQVRMHYQWAKSIDSASSMHPQAVVMSVATASAFGDLATLPYIFASYDAATRGLTFRPVLPIVTTRPRLPQYSLNLTTSGERALSDFDVRHRVVLNYVYTLSSAAPRILRNWQFSGITTLQEGQPYSVFASVLGSPLRLSQRGTVVTDNGNPAQAIENKFNITKKLIGDHIDLTDTLALKPGNLARNAFSGPGLVNADFSVMRDFGLGEKVKLQLRAEFFNLLDRANFRQPYSQAGNVVPFYGSAVFIPDYFFGQILQARPGRDMQFALKLWF